MEELLKRRKLAGMQRRIRALPEEIQRWRQRTEGNSLWERHHSQIHALEVYMSQIVKLMEQEMEEVAGTTGHLKFINEALSVELAANEVQRMWQFFRDKFEQRWSQDSGPALRAADTIAWDCYHFAIDQARAVYHVLDSWDYREPPLVYADTRFSPATLVRGATPREAGFDTSSSRFIPWQPRSLPIPLVILPWDRLCNPWELLSLHHEVAHDIEKDLGLLPELQSIVNRVAGKTATWQCWVSAIFADLAAVLFAGPAFIGMMVDLLSFPEARVRDTATGTAHPVPHGRVHILTSFAGTLDIPKAKAAADRYQEVWTSLYGELPQFQSLLDRVSEVVEAVANTPLQKLGGISLRELVPLEMSEVNLIEVRAGTLQAGNPLAKGSLEPRFICAAARLAFEAIAAGSKDTNRDEEINRLAANTIASIENNTPTGKRAGRKPPEEPIRERAALFLNDLLNTGTIEDD